MGKGVSPRILAGLRWCMSPNINKMSMQAVLDYLYTKQLSPNLDLDPLELIALANRFCLPHLVALAGKADDSGPCGI